MKVGPGCWLRVVVGAVSAVSLSCGSGSDSAPASAGAPNGGATSGASGTSGAAAGGKAGAGTSGSAGGAGGAVDCAGVCEHVKVLCAANGTIDDNWLDACKQVCDTRAQLTPDVAQLEQTCVMGAADCSASIVCVASPH